MDYSGMAWFLSGILSTVLSVIAYEVAKRSRGIRTLRLEMSQQVWDRLENLRVKTEALSVAEVVSRSLAVYECLHDAQAKGQATLILENGDPRDVDLH